MRIDKILEHNRAFVARRAPAPLPGATTLPLAIVACYDPRLDALLHDALGVALTEAFLFRVAGALLRPDSNSLRSLANSVFFFGVSEVVIVGHSSCRMATFSSSEYIDAFRKRGVERDAFGPGDLRDWAGAIPGPRAGVERSLDALATAPYLPADLQVSGLVLDDTTGALEVVSAPSSLAKRRGTLPIHSSSSNAEGPSAPGISYASLDPTMTYASLRTSSHEQAQPGSAHAREQAPSTDAGPEPSVGAEDAPKVKREIEDMREFVRLLESASGWKEELVRVRAEIARQHNPFAKLALVEAFLRRATVNAKDAAGTFERLKDEAAKAKGFNLDQLLALFFGASGKAAR